MPASTTCKIDVKFALALADLMRAMDMKADVLPFRCAHCGQPVKPFYSEIPHFKHLDDQGCTPTG